LGIKRDERVILFIAPNVADRRKGGEYLSKSLQRLSAEFKQAFTALIIGPNAHSWENTGTFNTRVLGPVTNEEMLAACYSCADVFVMPSIADNFPNTVLEAMACGTPCVAFDVGGVPEMVRHMETGYLAKYKDVGDFTKGLHLLLTDDALREKLGTRSVEVVKAEYTVELMAKRYLDLYEETVQSFSKSSRFQVTGSKFPDSGILNL
jgi:glycosyltransferase involved in cell wall biosynthesis